LIVHVCSQRRFPVLGSSPVLPHSGQIAPCGSDRQVMLSS